MSDPRTTIRSLLAAGRWQEALDLAVKLDGLGNDAVIFGAWVANLVGGAGWVTTVQRGIEQLHQIVEGGAAE